MQAVKGVLEKEGYQTVCPRVSPENVKDPKLGAAESYPGQKLKLEVGATVQLALNVVLEDKLGKFVVSQALKNKWSGTSSANTSIILT